MNNFSYTLAAQPDEALRERIGPGRVAYLAGGTNLIEAVRQLFGEGGKRQVAKTSNALVTGIGGIPYGRNWMSSAVIILTPNA